MKEKLIERKLTDGFRKRGGIAIKLLSPSLTGLPDRLCLLFPGRLYFVELKSTGKELRPRQIVIKRLLEKLGFVVDVIDDQEGLDQFFKTVDRAV